MGLKLMYLQKQLKVDLVHCESVILDAAREITS